MGLWFRRQEGDVLRLRYLGVMKPYVKTAGCSSCGNRSTTVSGATRASRADIALPSGNILPVRMGVPFEINDKDGLYLSELTYVYDNQTYYEFEVL